MANLGNLPQPAAACLPAGVTDTQGKDAFTLRFGTATAEAVKTGTITDNRNSDLTKFPNGLGTYSKALKQASPGIAAAGSFNQFLKACGVEPGGPVGDFENTAIVRGGTAKLNGPRGAFSGQLIGKDSAGFGNAIVPPAPALDSIEYAIELVELYWASLLRDVPFEQYAANATALAACNELSALAAAHPGKFAYPVDAAGRVTPGTLFRGAFAGETNGPYLSQFAVVPTTLGRLPISQMIKTYLPAQDFMTTQSEWFNIQNGLDPAETAVFDPVHRFMRAGRDIAAYTQVDELYQAYLIADLVCETAGIPPNPGNPYLTYTNDKAFGTFGGPDIAATIGAVARAAINAVWYQKWRVHLRHRPEAGGGIAHLLKTGQLPPAVAAQLPHFDIVLNSAALNLSAARNGSYLLSQAFPEGSPTHPAYPTGHGTVAGACITVLKFFYDGNTQFANLLAPSADGLILNAYPNGAAPVTVNDELHKIAHNISFGHGIHAGIHWRSDTDTSILLGEAVAIAYLQDQIYSYQENFDIKITKIDGSTQSFKNF
jgi:hypothetical protein